MVGLFATDQLRRDVRPGRSLTSDEPCHLRGPTRGDSLSPSNRYVAAPRALEATTTLRPGVRFTPARVRGWVHENRLTFDRLSKDPERILEAPPRADAQGFGTLHPKTNARERSLQPTDRVFKDGRSNERSHRHGLRRGEPRRNPRAEARVRGSLSFVGRATPERNPMPFVAPSSFARWEPPELCWSLRPLAMTLQGAKPPPAGHRPPALPRRGHASICDREIPRTREIGRAHV